MDYREQNRKYSIISFALWPYSSLFSPSCHQWGARSYMGKLKAWQERKDKLEQKGKLYKTKAPKPVQEFHCAPVFYKGQYKNFTAGEIILKLWTGNSWAWVKHKYRGRELPPGGEKLSPTVVLGKKYAQLHIPVKESVLDTRAAKERIESKENICAVHFSNSDNFAVCCVYGGNGSIQKILFIRGGRQYVHRSKSLLNRIRKNMKLMGKRFDWKGCNRKYWRHIYNLGEYYAHRVSKEIINFCGENNVKVIAIAKIAEDAPWYKKRVGVYSPAYLSKRIMRYLQYKAWKKGIVISSVRPHYTAQKCNVCRNYIKRQRKEFSCPQGHRGNYGLNAAKNIGKMCFKKFGYQISSEGA